jgi:proteasome accessory factor B
VDRLERLVNLVAALLDSPRPLTRAEIKERTPGYSSDPEAFRRNFERDKDLLRQMGFPLVTEAPDPGFPEDVGYRIPPEQYELPDPGLDGAELAALRLAASAVQLEGSGEAVVAALRKLAGAVDGADVVLAANPAPADLGAALPTDDSAATVLMAVGERRRVRFGYHGERRLVDPWRLSFHRGHWYLSGFDHQRQAERLFRLDRVEGSVEAEGDTGAFERPGVATAGPPAPWLMGDGEEIVTRILVDADQASWARHALGREVQSRPDGSAVFEVTVTNRDALRSFVLGYLDHAEILAPPDLRADMVHWLEELAGPGAGGE